jgi:hypothetical protein
MEEPTEKNSAYAYLRIAGFPGTVAELSQRLGLEPTESWNAGDVVGRSQRPRKFNEWNLRSRLPDSERLERHIVDVLEQVRGREDVLRAIADDCGIVMECVGYFYEYYPGFALESDLVRQLGACGFALDLDFYPYFAEDEGEEEQ